PAPIALCHLRSPSARGFRAAVWVGRLLRRRPADDRDQADHSPALRRIATASAVHAHPRARRAGDDDGRGAAPVLRRVERADAAAQALRAGHTFYPENAGLPSLRRGIAEQYRRLHGVELDPDREIVVTASGLLALHLAIRSAIDPGDEAIVLSPAWPNGAAI